ncbi:MAG: AAA family ATPase [Rheinheimera sp.]|nr:AAA family ATPase [Rheinheimera sp.]
MVVWTIANQKGGVGKTTSTVTLGALLAQRGERVLLIDTDPHASLTYYFGIDAEELENSVYDIFIRGKGITKEEILQSLCPERHGQSRYSAVFYGTGYPGPLFGR